MNGRSDAAMVISYALLNVADILTTQYILSHGGTEMYPLADAIIKQGWWLSWLIKVGVGTAIACLLYVVAPKKSWRIAMVAIILLMCLVVGNNVIEIISH